MTRPTAASKLTARWRRAVQAFMRALAPAPARDEDTVFQTSEARVRNARRHAAD
jgi:hypothetical protein